MEGLLQQFYEEGIMDLSFIIINAHDSLSVLVADELKRRVSFPVYQDNIDDNIWNLLNGGKDDMYIYDRCGRLTFYIPFPLSIIHPDQPIVSAAIHATYFHDLCGESCLIPEEESGIPLEYQNSLDHMEGNSTNNTVILDVEDIKTVLDRENKANSSEVLVDDVGDEFSFPWAQNHTAFDNETEILSNYTDETILMNTTELPDNTTDSSNTIYITFLQNTTGILENATVQITTKKKSFWDMAFGLFSSNKSTDSEKTEVSNEPTVKGRCRDPSHEKICEEWSKSKLWHAQKCCDSSDKTHQIHKHCKHFKAKRCKKLQPILKCCLGTVDAPTEQSLTDGVTPNQEYFATTG